MTALQGNSDYTTRSLVLGVLPAATYHFEFGGEASLVHGTHLQWDSALIAVATVWVCGLAIPLLPGGVPSTNATAGDWIQLQPTSRYVPISPTGACTENNLTMTIPGGTAGGCYIDVGNFSGSRLKIQLVVSTPGFFRGRANGKE